MSNTDFLNFIDQQTDHFQRLVERAWASPLPLWSLDEQDRIHPWLEELLDLDAEIWMLIQEEVRPRLFETEEGRPMYACLDGRWTTLCRLASRIEALWESLRGKIPLYKPLPLRQGRANERDHETGIAPD